MRDGRLTVECFQRQQPESCLHQDNCQDLPGGSMLMVGNSRPLTTKIPPKQALWAQYIIYTCNDDPIQLQSLQEAATGCCLITPDFCSQVWAPSSCIKKQALGPIPLHSKLILHLQCQHPLWVMVKALAALLPIPLLDKWSRKAAEKGQFLGLLHPLGRLRESY